MRLRKLVSVTVLHTVCLSVDLSVPHPDSRMVYVCMSDGALWPINPSTEEDE